MVISNDGNSMAVNVSLTDDNHLLLQQTQGNQPQFVILSHRQLQKIIAAIAQFRSPKW
jgi:hypothetical protein